MERARAWVAAYADALEAGDGSALAQAFAIECTWQPGPFAAPERGRRAVVAALLARAGRAPGLAIRAEMLGAGATYAVVHWRLGWAGAVPDEDGILLVALDVTGRCSALREWSTADPGAPVG
ncbi:MAG: nuclear transport factor 2 family protein [Chloroflexota bacterium]